jgi:hypothetical protein
MADSTCAFCLRQFSIQSWKPACATHAPALSALHVALASLGIPEVIMIGKLPFFGKRGPSGPTLELPIQECRLE